MKKIAFVVQRYGIEVNGGAELQCRQFAERMVQYYDVDVITTKAIDYITWRDEYSNDIEELNGVTVRRFGVDNPRDMHAFGKISEKVLQLGCTVDEEETWMKMQGPYSTQLLEYLKENKERYDVFIFFTYLYCTTYFGLPIVKDKAILIPTAHDERPIHLKIFNNLFHMPRAIFYETEVEKRFVEYKFRVKEIPNNGGMGGVGIELPQDISANRFINKYGVDNFILYIGRIDESKGCKELFEYFQRYKKKNSNNVKLVLLGKEVLPVPKSQDIISLGFVSDQDKFDALAACRILILPSRFESLSMVVLEAMAMKRPVIVSEYCEVVKEHCIKSNGGLYYRNYYDFEGTINYILEHNDIAGIMGNNGYSYIADNYTWDKIDKRLIYMIEHIVEND